MKIHNGKQKKIRDISDLMEYFGIYQVIQCVLTCLPLIFISMVNVNYVFVVGDVEYRCRIDECEDANSTAKFPIWWPKQNKDRCKINVLRDGEKNCSNNSFTGELVPCNEWIYESNNTIVAEFNLACQPWKSYLIGTVHNLGMILSTIMAGWMSDKFGRKPTLIFCAFGGSIGYIKTFATSYNMYVSVEFLEAVATGGTFSAVSVLLLEISGKKHRVLSMIIFAYAAYFGEAIFGSIAIFVRYWKTLLYIINGPCVLFIALIFCVNESPRWQVVCGEIEKAKQIMKKISKINKIHINNEEFSNMNENKLKEIFDIVGNDVGENILNAFKSKEIMKRMLVAAVCRFTSTFVYYGMLMNSVWIPGNKYMNFLLSSLMSFPGEILCLYLLNKVGRKIPLIVGYLMCGLLCIISAFVPIKYLWAKLVFFLAGKMIISACFTGTVTYTMELYPTSVRGSLVGIGDFACRTGGMLASLTPVLNTVSEVLPGIFFGCSTVIAASLLCLTLETKNLPLFDTIQQVESHAYNLKATNKNAAVSDCSINTINTNA